jgi:hypothetical protein
MKLREYFMLGIQHGLHKKQHWMTMLFTIVYSDGGNTAHYPYMPVIDDGVMYFHDPVGQRHEIEDYKPDRAPLHFRDEFILQPGEIANYKGDKPLRTTYGNVFVNHLCLVLPFGDIFEFQAGYFDITKIEGRLLDIMIDDPEDGDTVTPAADGKVYVWQYHMFAEHILAVPAYADQLVTSITPKSMMAHPDRNKVRDEWMVKNKDRLTDPAAIAELGQVLKKLDDEHLAGDGAEEFYKASSKSEGSRKKVFYMFGGESPFSDGTSVVFIKKSLEEGIDMDNLPVMNNSTRAGSYGRGAQTALGGESTKTIYRMVGNVRIAEHDCNTHIGMPTRVHGYSVNSLIGYGMIVDGKTVIITPEIAQASVGKMIEVRGPMSCKSGRDVDKGILGKGKNICAVCAGQSLAENPNGIPAAAAGVGGNFLSLFMKKMHASTLKTVKWDMANRIT